MIEDVIRETLQKYSYSASDECIDEMVRSIELKLDDTGWVACE